MTESEDAYVNSKAITVFQYFQMLRKALRQWTGQTLECPTQFKAASSIDTIILYSNDLFFVSRRTFSFVFLIPAEYSYWLSYAIRMQNSLYYPWLYPLQWRVVGISVNSCAYSFIIDPIVDLDWAASSSESANSYWFDVLNYDILLTRFPTYTQIQMRQ